MIIDPETAHNITNGAAVVMDSGAGAATAAEVNIAPKYFCNWLIL